MGCRDGCLQSLRERTGFLELAESVDDATVVIGDTVPDRGGRRRRVYRIQPEGARALREWYGGIQNMASGLLPQLDRFAEGKG